ncbi:MAG: hypothetical protein AAB354_08975, partial [candidate division KSB1 bacterium]
MLERCILAKVSTLRKDFVSAFVFPACQSHNRPSATTPPGNALDNGANNKADAVIANPHKPDLPGNFKTIGDQEKKPDNYFWNFKVQNDIDRTIPFISKVKPNLDGEGVKGTDPVQISFNKKMLSYSLPGGIGILEYPSGVKGKDGVPLDQFAYYVQSFDTTTADYTVA